MQIRRATRSHGSHCVGSYICVVCLCSWSSSALARCVHAKLAKWKRKREEVSLIYYISVCVCNTTTIYVYLLCSTTMSLARSLSHRVGHVEGRVLLSHGVGHVQRLRLDGGHGRRQTSERTEEIRQLELLFHVRLLHTRDVQKQEEEKEGANTQKTIRKKNILYYRFIKKYVFLVRDASVLVAVVRLGQKHVAFG
jgi:hypothetical protein